MPFTNKFGTDDSRFGNLVFGGAPSSPPPPPPPVVASSNLPIVQAMPKIPGVGWARFGRPYTEPIYMDPPGTLAPIIGVRTFAPEYFPRIPGVGWARFGPPIVPTILMDVEPEPLVGVRTFAPEYFPRIPGVGWARFGPPQTIVPPYPPSPWVAPAPPVVPPPPGVPPPEPIRTFPNNYQPFVERSPVEEPRLRRHTEKVAALLNSLLLKGMIRQEGAEDFVIVGGAIVQDRDPTAIDDSTVGCAIGSSWVNRASQTTWICVANAVGSAVWRQTS